MQLTDLYVTVRFCPYAVENHEKDDQRDQLFAWAPIMEARYKGGEAALEECIQRFPNATVLEIAAGFSLHGAELAEKYPTISYIDSDYDQNSVVLKQSILQEELLQVPLNNLQFTVLNAMNTEELMQMAERLDSDRPIIIYNEGLMAYMNATELQQLAANIKGLLGKFGGAWVTPDPALSEQRRVGVAKLSDDLAGLIRSAETLAEQNYQQHGFKNPEEADIFFAKNGFTIEKFSQPTDLHSFDSAKINPDLAIKLQQDIKDNGRVWVLTTPVVHK